MVKICYDMIERIFQRAHTVYFSLSVRVRSLGSLTGGLVSGLSCLASGVAIGTVANSATRAVAEEPKFFIGMILILIFAEALGESSVGYTNSRLLDTCTHTTHSV